METETVGKSLYGGWPLVKRNGETVIQCPHCTGTDITITTERGAYGTGPGGRWRMGDPGGREVAVCKCGAKGYWSDAPEYFR